MQQRGGPPNRGGPPHGGYRNDPPPSVRLSQHYLKAGYFDENGNLHPSLLATKGRPTPGLDQTTATDLDSAICALKYGAIRNSRDTGIKATQLRRFFNQLKQLESMASAGTAFERVVPGLLRLEAQAAYAVGRGVACEPFHEFIHRNVLHAQLSAEHLRRGFVPHFEAVVAYTVYYFGENERS